MFSDISDADLRSSTKPFAEVEKKNDPLAGHTPVDPSQAKKEAKSAAAKDVYQSLWILVGLGAFRLTLSIYFLVNIERDVDFLMVADTSGEGDRDALLLVLKIIYGINISIGAMFLICAGLVFIMPLTCTITAFVVWIISEIIGLVLNPLGLMSVRGWMIKAVIFGGLLQAINNAAYYKFVKSGGRDG